MRLLPAVVFFSFLVILSNDGAKKLELIRSSLEEACLIHAAVQPESDTVFQEGTSCCWGRAQASQHHFLGVKFKGELFLQDSVGKQKHAIHQINAELRLFSVSPPRRQDRVGQLHATQLIESRRLQTPRELQLRQTKIQSGSLGVKTSVLKLKVHQVNEQVTATVCVTVCVNYCSDHNSDYKLVERWALERHLPAAARLFWLFAALKGNHFYCRITAAVAAHWLVEI